MQYRVPNMKKVIFLRKIIKTWIKCSEKWSEYYTCKECEDKVNRKGHLMKPQETFHVDNVKYIIIKSEQNIILFNLPLTWGIYFLLRRVQLINPIIYSGEVDKRS